MKSSKSIPKQDKIEFKNIIKIIEKRKWWLVCSATLVLILELIYTLLNHKDYLLIFNIAAAIIFSITIGAMLVFAVELFSCYTSRKRSENLIQKD